MVNLERLANAASGYMSRDHADVIARNIAAGLEELDAGGTSELGRFAYVLATLRRNADLGLRLHVDPEIAAAAIVNAWSSAPRGTVDWYVERADRYVDRLELGAETPAARESVRQLRVMIDCWWCDQHPGTPPLIGVGLHRTQFFCGLCDEPTTEGS